MKISKYNLRYITNYLDDVIKTKEYNFDEISKEFNLYFLNLYNNYFKKYKKIDNDTIYKIRDYAVIDGGKRLRPFLMFLTSYCLGDKNINSLEPFMLGIELIHSYSLIHDDLPCMDNDRIRRGKSSVWAKYGEALGVLSGDALLTDAFKVMLDANKNFDINDIKKAYSLAYAASSIRLINGQIQDINNTYVNNYNVKKIIELYKNKTGALFQSATYIAAINYKINNNFNNDLKNMGEMLGIAFQIQDDLMEISDKKINKPKNSDKKNNKNTYLKKNGMEKSNVKIKSYLNKIYNIIDKYINNKNKNILYKNFIMYMIKI